MCVASLGAAVRPWWRPGWRGARVKKIASELLVERLVDRGVDTVFGLPGDGINGIKEGLGRHQHRTRPPPSWMSW